MHLAFCFGTPAKVNFCWSLVDLPSLAFGYVKFVNEPVPILLLYVKRFKPSMWSQTRFSSGIGGMFATAVSGLRGRTVDQIDCGWGLK